MTSCESDLEVAIQCAWCGSLRAEGGEFEPGLGDDRLDGERSHGICAMCLERELLILEAGDIVD